MLSAILLSTGSVFLLGRAVFGKKKRGKSTTMEKREQLGSRLGFIMISAGCAIGCGNVWKFPWMCGQNGGGGFMLIYLICLLILGPVSYTHLRAHETRHDLVCRLLLEKKKKKL